jgi:hypothetical protein
MVADVVSGAFFQTAWGIKVTLPPQINLKQANRISGGWLVNEIHDMPVPRGSLPAGIKTI